MNYDIISKELKCNLSNFILSILRVAIINIVNQDYSESYKRTMINIITNSFNYVFYHAERIIYESFLKIYNKYERILLKKSVEDYLILDIIISRSIQDITLIRIF
jgi:hypothetical protein